MILDDWLDGDDITEVTKADLEEFFIDLQEEYAEASVAIHYRNLRAFYNWAEREDIIDVSPMRKMVAPKVTTEHRRIVDDDDLAALLRSCGTGVKGRRFEDLRDEALMRLFNEAGSPRVAEMAGIELGTLDTRHSRVTLLGKGSVVRTIPFGDKTATAMERYIRARAKHPRADLPALWLGAFQRGRFTSSGIARMFRRRCGALGIPHVHPHLLRHTAFHHFKLAGGSDTDAEILFGWSAKSRMPAHYGASANVERAHQAARRLSVADRL